MSNRSFLRAAVLGGFVAAAPVSAEGPLVVHEWGTFTSLQDESGDAIGGVNSDDEPVPWWVHDLARMLVIGNPVQGAPKCHPDVTMRLETPVIYFHPPDATPVVLDVRARFRGGWLTQFYPEANADAPGLDGPFEFGPLTGETVGELSWEGLRVGGSAVGPQTDEHVWRAPRKVRAASVTTRKGERERFLFYRGVGHVDAPLRVTRAGRELVLRGALDGAWATDARLLTVPHLWLVEVRGDGTSAYRTLEPMILTTRDRALPVQTAATFPTAGFDKGNLGRLREAMRAALVEEGLFGDEAEALLSTWELSYFKSPGLRLFFTVPRPWTDSVLPLELSLPAKLTRVMVGRIELVTPEHRSLLRELAALPGDESDARTQERRGAIARKLGRFADALVLDEARRSSSKR